MKYRFFSTILLVIVVLFTRATSAQVTVNANMSAAQLAAKLTGPGVTVLNPVLTCPTLANGVFTAVSTNLGIDSGIVLTTGRAATSGSVFGVDGPAYTRASASNGAPGDPELEALAGVSTHDACALEFDVIPQGDTIKFDYVFGSEEYINAVCGPYNDAFAFFISGAGISGQQNMALVPGTSIPVTINSINNGIPGPSYSIAACNNMGPGAPFTSYYIDNSSGTNLTYQGFTKVLQAYHAVTPCNTYHLKMVIADGSNFIYDSGVFIRAGSLQANTFKITAISPDTTRTVPFAVKGCAPGTFRIHRPQAKPLPETVKYIITGTAVNGYDYATIADSVLIPAYQQEATVTIQGLATPLNGTKSVRLLVKSPLNCSGAAIADSATLLLYDTIRVKIATPPTTLCLGENIRLVAVGDTALTYQWLPLGSIDSSGIAQPSVVPARSTTYIVKASWPALGCPAKMDSVRIDVLPVPEINFHSYQHVCLHQPFTFDATVTPPYAHYTYRWDGPNGFNATTVNTTLPDVTKIDSGFYTLIVGLDTSRCVAVDSFHLAVDYPDPPVVTPIVFCQDKPAEPLRATGSQLLWYAAETGGTGSATPPIPATHNLGITHYYVSQTRFGCEGERSDIAVEIKVCCAFPVFVPTAFTPNNDGHNDGFLPKYSGYGQATSRLRIYNRWGQMVYQTFDESPWNGQFNGTEAPMGSYYYQLIVNCKEGNQQTFTGDVQLVR